jgi:hypothetical protein
VPASLFFYFWSYNMTPNEWKAKVLDRHRILRDVVGETRDLLSAIPQNIPPQERLDLVVELWNEWGLDSEALTASPPRGARNRAHSWFSPGTQESMADVVGLFAHNLERAIETDLRAGATHPALIRTADFGPAGVNFMQVPGDAFQMVAVGRVENLPHDHPILRLSVRYYQTSTGPQLILGAAAGTLYKATAKPFYDLRGSLFLTEQWATRQAREEEARLQEQERQEAYRRAARSNDPTARLADRIAELERKLAAQGG